MSLHFSSDVGGTFTDMVSFDGETFRIAKSPTTPEDYAEGIENCISILGEEIGESDRTLMEQCAYFGHGSTVITNAVIEGKVGKVGLLVTRGFRDILSIREGGTENTFDVHKDCPRPYVPRYLTVPVLERVNAEGGIEIPLDDHDVERALKILVEQYRVDAVAVCFLWSVTNPAHEQRIREIMAEKWPDIPCVLSCETNPIIREYRRACSTVIEASVRTLADRYIRNLSSRLEEKGHKGTLYMVTSSGSLLAAEDAAKRGISLIASGPAMAPVAAAWFDAMEGDKLGNVIAIDMGGTSFDVSMVTEGEIARTRDTKVGDELLGISTIDSRSIGAGGGSIAWIDSGGLIHIGPESAGAVPGPACYNRGGKRATVTDANVVLGYIDPDYFLGGRMRIEPKLAVQAIKEDVAVPLQLEIEEAAFTVWSTINVNMVSAIQDVTIWQGIDPREYVLVSGGGAGNCHAVALARELGIKKLLVPKYGGVLSAVGGLVADVCADFSGGCFTATSDFDYDRVNKLLENLEDKAQRFLSRVVTGSRGGRVEFFVEARYPYQVWELPVRLGTKRISNEEDLRRLVEDFHEVHEKVFAIREPGQFIECVQWSTRAVAEMPKVKLKEQAYHGEDPAAALMSEREAYFRERGGMAMSRVYRGDKLLHGNVIYGPAIIEETTTTVVIPPESRATVTRWGNYWIDIQ